MTGKITNYYLPGYSKEIVLMQDKISHKGRTKFLGMEEEETLSQIMNVGFANCITKNRLYLQAIENLKITDIDNKSLVESLISNKIGSSNPSFDFITTNKRSFEENRIDYLQATEIIKLRVQSKWSINSLCAKFCITKSQLQRIFKMV